MPQGSFLKIRKTHSVPKNIQTVFFGQRKCFLLTKNIQICGGLFGEMKLNSKICISRKNTYQSKGRPGLFLMLSRSWVKNLSKCNFNHYPNKKEAGSSLSSFAKQNDASFMGPYFPKQLAVLTVK